MTLDIETLVGKWCLEVAGLENDLGEGQVCALPYFPFDFKRVSKQAKNLNRPRIEGQGNELNFDEGIDLR